MTTAQKSAFATASAALLTITLTPAAMAATITVNDTNDELNENGNCSLREAIQAANTDTAVDACALGSGADTIVVPAGTGKEDNNLAGDLDIKSDISLVGAGWASTIIDAAGLDRPLHIACLPNLNPGPGQPTCEGITTVSVRGLTFRGGDPGEFGSGGGVLVRGNVSAPFSPVATIDDCRFTENTASAGGALQNESSLLLRNSLIDHNTAANDGGGFTNVAIASVVIADSHILDNESRESKAIWVGSASLRQRNPGLCDTVRDLEVAPEPSWSSARFARGWPAAPTLAAGDDLRGSEASASGSSGDPVVSRRSSMLQLESTLVASSAAPAADNRGVRTPPSRARWRTSKRKRSARAIERTRVFYGLPRPASTHRG